MEDCARSKSEEDPWLEVELESYAKVYRVEVVSDGSKSRLDGVTIDVGGVKCQTEVQSPDPGGKKQVTCNGIGRTVRITRPGVDKQLGLCGIKVFGDAVEKPVSESSQGAPRITSETETNIEYKCHCTCGTSPTMPDECDYSAGPEKGCYIGSESDCNKKLDQDACNLAENSGFNKYCMWQPTTS